MNLNKELKARWKRYVESYGYDTSKKIHLISATHVVNRIIDTATDSHEKRKLHFGCGKYFYNIAISRNKIKCQCNHLCDECSHNAENKSEEKNEN